MWEVLLKPKGKRIPVAHFSHHIVFFFFSLCLPSLQLSFTTRRDSHLPLEAPASSTYSQSVPKPAPLGPSCLAQEILPTHQLPSSFITHHHISPGPGSASMPTQATTFPDQPSVTSFLLLSPALAL